MNFERALIEEIAGLERELEGDPRFQKLRVLQAALAYYRPNDSGGASPYHQGSFSLGSATHRNVPAHHGSGANYDAAFVDKSGRLVVMEMKRKGGRQRDPERQRALDEAVKFVQQHGGMPTTAEVFAHLTGLGISIGGQSPQGNLSAMLYKDGRLTSHGRAGWTFGPPPTDTTESEKASEENEPSDAGALDGSDAESDEDRCEALRLTNPFHPAS